ncbi:actin-related protein 2/3 complex subunit 5-C-like [Rhopilema esculentum]|uniref:actin-related protein 2/3 complex subunit 5-C-like n=1 Tax=Rhopilema esculentum TaxID=499914 RepID=UPI0031CE54C2|eukprot:gene10444-19149_t
MSKSSSAREFRKVDVDKFDEDVFQDDQAEEVQDQGPSEGDIQQLLMSKKNNEALKLLLEQAPAGSKNKERKDKAFDLIIRVLTAYKSSEVEAAAKSLNFHEIDVLMKYIYRGFSEPSDSYCASLLTWHDKLVAHGGHGSIIRVLADRKTV